MDINGTVIDDTFAEAFDMKFARLEVTAKSQRWLDAAIHEACGYSASVIGCDAEAGLEKYLAPSETFDGRIGASILFFGMKKETLSKAVINRTGQCLMTCPTVSVFDGLRESEMRIPLGKHLRFFGDGFQKSKLIGSRRIWRVPVMDGEFLIDDKIGIGKGVAGGNLIIQGTNLESALAAAERSVDAIAKCDGVILPFPGGLVRAGSKVGSVYKGLVASTNDGYCPTLRGRVESKLLPDANAAYEVVIDGKSFDVIATAMNAGIQAACGSGTVMITAGNYGGKLGKHHFQLHEIAK